MLDMEYTLRKADLALGNDGMIFLPYWDWTKKPAGQPFLPKVLQEIMSTDTYKGIKQEGGLFHDTFLPLDKAGKQIAPRERDGTLFYKTNPWNDELDAELEASVGRYKVDKTTTAVITSPDHASAAHQLDRAPHGSIHVAVGSVGRETHGTEMVGNIPTAGFHPTFWMHHCNIDRVYESYLKTRHGRNAKSEWKGRLDEEGGGVTGAGFPDGEWGRYEPFGVNPKTGKQYGCADTFDTAALGYVYSELYTPPPQRLRELPTLAMFEGIQKVNVNGSKELFIYLSDGSWTEPADLRSLDHEALTALPGFAAVTALFVQPEVRSPRPLSDGTEGATRRPRCLRGGVRPDCHACLGRARRIATIACATSPRSTSMPT